MLQVVHRLSGRLTECPCCKGQPIHVHVRGADLHFLECPRCQIRTNRCDTVTGAIADWEHRNTAPAPVAPNVIEMTRNLRRVQG